MAKMAKVKFVETSFFEQDPGTRGDLASYKPCSGHPRRYNEKEAAYDKKECFFANVVFLLKLVCHVWFNACD